LPDGSLVRDQTAKLRLKYHPIEYDVQMSVEEKIPYMIEWYHETQSLILASNLNRSLMRELIYQSKMELRKGVHDFITELLCSQTPILIFSAGLGKEKSFSSSFS
jgi:5'-nucleotidase